MPDRTASPALTGILDYFYQWEAQQPHAVFLRQPEGRQWRITTWAEAGRQARILANALHQLGLQPGDHVGLISKNCAHWIIADLALMMAGLVSVPYYPNLTRQQLAEVIAASDLKALLVGKLDDWPSQRPGVPDHLPMVAFPHYAGNSMVTDGLAWDDLMQRYPPLPGNPSPGLHERWTILFTSGTTGSPKGVVHTYHAPAALLHNEKVHNNLKIFSGTTHRYFSYLPLCHIAERIIIEVAAILTGGSISFAENLDTFARNLQDTQPTLFLAVPRIWSKFQLAILARLPQRRLTRLLGIPLLGAFLKKKIRRGLGLDQARILLTGAAPTPDSLKSWFLQFDLVLQEVYAMTENCGGCTLMPIEDVRPGAVGKALPGVEIKIDPLNGEVLTRAPWLMEGYYQDPVKTAEVLRDGWLHTGDQGELTSDGYLRITGRVVDTFKSAKGKFIVPAPIEWGFAENSAIEQVCVVGLSLPQPLALVVLSEQGRQVPRPELEQSLRQSLAEVNASLVHYERLAKLVVVQDSWSVENGLMTPTMKIRRSVLNDTYAERLATWSASDMEIIWENSEQ